MLLQIFGSININQTYMWFLTIKIHIKNHYKMNSDVLIRADNEFIVLSTDKK